MRCLIITGGRIDIDFTAEFLKNRTYDFVIGADAGLQAMRALGQDVLDAQMRFSIRLYCHGTVGMTREWLLTDNITPAETIVQMMFDSMPERLSKTYFG